MINITFTAAAVEALRQERFYHRHPRAQRRMEAVYLKSQGLCHEEIGRLVGISQKTLRRYVRRYQAGGIEGLKELKFRRPQSALVAHRGSLEARFREHPVATVAEAQAVIEQQTGLRRWPTQARRFLRQMGIARRKAGIVPAKADVEKQEAFRTRELEPRLAQAQAGQRAVFFVDASRFVLGAFIGFLWSFARVLVKTPSGRQRFNVLGALNPITLQILTVVNDTYITAEQVCRLLRQVAELGLDIPITLIMDNARYQRCCLAQNSARDLGIELLFLPAYSPNLNLIERVWKFVKKQCLYSKYYADFASFKTAVYDCVTQAHNQHRTALASLATLKFQTFKAVAA